MLGRRKKMGGLYSDHNNDSSCGFCLKPGTGGEEEGFSECKVVWD